MTKPVAVIRAHNEQGTVGDVVDACADIFDVYVALSGCEDDTETVARRHGAATFVVPLGVGAATTATVHRFRSIPFLLLDGDITSVVTDALPLLYDAAADGHMGKGVYDQPGRASALIGVQAQAHGVELPGNVRPDSLTSAHQGIPARLESRVDMSMVPDRRGADLMLSVLAYRAGYSFVGVDVGERLHRHGNEPHVERLTKANSATLSVLARCR